MTSTSRTLTVLAVHVRRSRPLRMRSSMGQVTSSLVIASAQSSDSQKKQLGQELRRKFLDAIPGLEPLIDAVKQRVRTSNRLRGLDGRPIFCQAEHASLNYLLQSAGAIISKRWLVIGQDMLDEAGLTYDRDYTRCAYVHDEQQFSVVPAEADHVASLRHQPSKLVSTTTSVYPSLHQLTSVQLGQSYTLISCKH